MECSEILKSLRLLSEQSATELAEKTGISRSYVYAIENGSNPNPGIDVVKKWVMATRPKGDDTDWMTLSLQLVYDARMLEKLEKKTESPEKALGWLEGLIPKRFLMKVIKQGG
jgi:transcriptional regulator with XRE-family HTH domain